MGGKAHGNVSSKVNSKERDEILSKLLPRLKKYFTKVQSPYPAPEKSIHGDIDIIVAGPLTKYVISDIAANIHLFDRQQKDSYLYEYNAKKIQVDLTVCTELEFDNILFAHDYGDLSMIIGASVKAWNMVFALGKLFWQEKVGPEVRRYCIAENPKEVCQILNLEFDRYMQGFNKLIEIFVWISSMRPTLKEIDPKKDHRPMYTSFIQWNSDRLVGNQGELDYKWIKSKKEELKKSQLFAERVIKPHKAAVEADNKKREYKKIVNVEKVRILAKSNCPKINREIEGKELGEVMKKVRQRFKESESIPAKDALEEEIIKILGELP